ncbi:hypothetical protein ETB97_008310 [Aspergillus alliaceus]|uniref:Aromatic-ring-hydroxylating dioxygenase alpha subunit C-terminal domain-containing protein n=1 Tax=Petromyces alliaceus TaxID=209559 RepID=A0A8H5ZVE5_PETAA|nr:hypothetical protein ETB97_008310 [Aspergillus burnettii]
MAVERGNIYRYLYHLHDGPEQEERDRKMQMFPTPEGETLVWREPGLAPKLLGYDNIADASPPIPKRKRLSQEANQHFGIVSTPCTSSSDEQALDPPHPSMSFTEPVDFLSFVNNREGHSNAFTTSAATANTQSSSSAPQNHFQDIDEQPRMKTLDFSGEFPFDHYWEMDLDGNRKALIENYSECYHSQTPHPRIAGASDIEHYYVESRAGYMALFLYNKDRNDILFRRVITFFRPTTYCY